MKSWDFYVTNRSRNKPSSGSPGGRLLLLIIFAINYHLPPSVQGQRKACRKNNGGIKKAGAAIAVAGRRDIFSALLKVLLGERTVNCLNHVADGNRIKLTADNHPPALPGVNAEAHRLPIVAVKPGVVKPGMAVMQGGYERHGSKIKGPAVIGRAQNLRQIFMVVVIKLAPVKFGIKRCDLMVNLRRDQDTIQQRNVIGCLRCRCAAGKSKPE